jgi:aspartyl/asparaginyl-tRNA synthetase
MHTVRLTIHDTIYEKLMGLLEILPKDKIEIIEEKDEFPAISFDEAKLKVERAMNNIPKNEGLDLSTAIEKVIRS